MSQFLYVLDPFFVRTKRDVDLPMVVASVSHVDPEAVSESYSYSNVQTSEAEGLKKLYFNRENDDKALDLVVPYDKGRGISASNNWDSDNSYIYT